MKKNQPPLVTVKYCYLLKNVGKKNYLPCVFSTRILQHKKDFFFQICQPNFLQKIFPSICFYISNTRAYSFQDLFSFDCIDFWLKILFSKGQLISKGLFGILNSSKKRTKKFNLTTTDTSG